MELAQLSTKYEDKKYAKKGHLFEMYGFIPFSVQLYKHEYKRNNISPHQNARLVPICNI